MRRCASASVAGTREQQGAIRPSAAALTSWTGAVTSPLSCGLGRPFFGAGPPFGISDRRLPITVVLQTERAARQEACSLLMASSASLTNAAQRSSSQWVLEIRASMVASSLLATA